jgi:Condensation domain
MKADLAKVVDLLHGPFFCFALFKAAPDQFFWYERFHHILMDGFGVTLFERRVADVYTALANKNDTTPQSTLSKVPQTEKPEL